ncbi:hypothetical protein L0F63_002178, partial [Massospora cicadina]
NDPSALLQRLTSKSILLSTVGAKNSTSKIPATPQSAAPLLSMTLPLMILVVASFHSTSITYLVCIKPEAPYTPKLESSVYLNPQATTCSPSTRP